MKLPIDALYLKLSKNIKDISIVFEKLFWSISVVNIKDFKAPPKLAFSLIIVDCRGVLDGYERALALLRRFSSIDSLLIYDYNNQDKLNSFIEAKVDFFLPYNLKKEHLREFLQRVINKISVEHRLKECQKRLNYCQERVPEEKTKDIDCIELQKHIQIMESFIKKTCRESDTLLQNILSMNRLLIQSELNERDVNFLGSALQSIAQLQDHFEDLEQFLIPEEKFSTTHKVAFNLNAILENVSIIMSKYWGEGGFNLIFNISNSVPARVLGNPILLSKVLVSILEMAIEVQKKGEIILDISVVEKNEKEFLYFNPIKHIKLNKTQKEILKKIIYKPQFLKVKNLVEMMKGEFESKEEEIVGIGFKIPLIRVDRRNYRLPSKDWMKKSILIIEKNEFVSNSLEEMLNYFHFEVQKSNTMQDAENRLYHKTFDLIFLDEELFDSFELYGYPLKRDAKVVIMAWPGTQKIRISDYLAKSDTILIKPFTQQKVFETILELYSNDILVEQRESLSIMKDNLGFLLKDKKALYIGDDDSDWLMVKGLLKGSLMGILRSDSLMDVDSKLQNSNLIILSPKVYEDKSWRAWLMKCPSLCKDKNIIALVDTLNPKLIKAIKKLGINQYLQTPINPDNFYRILMEELMG